MLKLLPARNTAWVEVCGVAEELSYENLMERAEFLYLWTAVLHLGCTFKKG